MLKCDKDVESLSCERFLYTLLQWINSQSFCFKSKRLPYFESLSDYSKLSFERLAEKIHTYNRLNIIKRWWLRLTSANYKNIDNEKAIYSLYLLRSKINHLMLKFPDYLMNQTEKSCLEIYHQLRSIQENLLNFLEAKSLRAYHFTNTRDIQMSEKNTQIISRLKTMKAKVNTVFIGHAKRIFSDLFRGKLALLKAFFSPTPNTLKKYKLVKVREDPLRKNWRHFLNFASLNKAYYNYYNSLREQSLPSNIINARITLVEELTKFYGKLALIPIEPDGKFCLQQLKGLQKIWESKLAELEKNNPPYVDNVSFSILTPSELIQWLAEQQFLMTKLSLFERGYRIKNFLVGFFIANLKLWMSESDKITDSPLPLRQFEIQESLEQFFKKFSLLANSSSPVITFSDLSQINKPDSSSESFKFFRELYSKYCPSLDPKAEGKNSDSYEGLNKRTIFHLPRLALVREPQKMRFAL